MKKLYIVSLVKNCILGGNIVADDHAITYHTGKVTIPNEYRHLEMKYENIKDIEIGWMFILPIILVKMKNDQEYKFVTFFNRYKFIKMLKEKGACK